MGNIDRLLWAVSFEQNTLVGGVLSCAPRQQQNGLFGKVLICYYLGVTNGARGGNVYTFCVANVYPYSDPCPTG